MALPCVEMGKKFFTVSLALLGSEGYSAHNTNNKPNTYDKKLLIEAR
jgi:hypothetical protein